MPIPGDMNINDNIPDFKPSPSQNKDSKPRNFLEGLRKSWMTRSQQKELPKKDSTNLFIGGKQEKRSKLRELLKKSPGNIPGGGGQFLKEERIKMEKKLFPKKYGEFISEKDNRKMMKEFKKDIFNTKNFQEKKTKEREYRFWKKITGYDK